MDLNLFVVDNRTERKIAVTMSPATKEDELATVSHWQTAWDSDYLQRPSLQKYALKTNDQELLALAAYELLTDYLVVHIAYMESHPASNPTLTREKKYSGIGRALVAFGVALSVNHNMGGDVVLEAKTTELYQHYMRQFHAVPLPYRDGGTAPRLLVADNAAAYVISVYLE
jgi:hypothetical protein